MQDREWNVYSEIRNINVNILGYGEQSRWALLSVMQILICLFITFVLEKLTLRENELNLGI